MIDPSFAALLCNPTGQPQRKGGPFRRAIGLNPINDRLVFVSTPGTPDNVGICNFMPMRQNLFICAAREM
jgi:hypothetical protein